MSNFIKSLFGIPACQFEIEDRKNKQIENLNRRSEEFNYYKRKYPNLIMITENADGSITLTLQETITINKLNRP